MINKCESKCCIHYDTTAGYCRYDTVEIDCDGGCKQCEFPEWVYPTPEDLKKPTLKIMLDKGAIMPTRAHEKDAGYDLYTPKRFVLPQNDAIFIDTGVHVIVPDGKCLVLKSKSGLMKNYKVLTTGLVDEEYVGSIGVMLFNFSGQMLTFERGEKISQFIITNYYGYETEQIYEMPETERGSGGFGSTGRT